MRMLAVALLRCITASAAQPPASNPAVLWMLELVHHWHPASAQPATGTGADQCVPPALLLLLRALCRDERRLEAERAAFQKQSGNKYAGYTRGEMQMQAPGREGAGGSGSPEADGEWVWRARRRRVGRAGGWRLPPRLRHPSRAVALMGAAGPGTSSFARDQQGLGCCDKLCPSIAGLNPAATCLRQSNDLHAVPRCLLQARARPAAQSRAGRSTASAPPTRACATQGRPKVGRVGRSGGRGLEGRGGANEQAGGRARTP